MGPQKLGVLVLIMSSLLNVSIADPRIVCYWNGGSVNGLETDKLNPQNINPYLCTHLIYAFGSFTEDNQLKPLDIYKDVEQGGYGNFTGLKSYNKDLKTLVAVGGWNEGSTRFSPLVTSIERRSQFVKNAVTFLRQNKFDGLDLNWQYPALGDGGQPKDRKNYAKLVQELREEFQREHDKTGRPRLLLTMAVPAGFEYIEKGYDVPKLNKHLDWFNILSFDYHSGFESSVNHHAPLYPIEEENENNTDLNINSTINFYVKAGASREKLVLGIPTYGRSYTLLNSESNEIGAPADGPGEQGEATREKGYLAYYEICQALKEEDSGWTVVQPNADALGPYAYNDNQWVGYDDEDIVRKKSKFVVEQNLGGIMFWSIDNDDFRGLCNGKAYPLIEAAKEAYLDSLSIETNDGDAIRKKATTKKAKASKSLKKRSIDDNVEDSEAINVLLHLIKKNQLLSKFKQQVCALDSQEVEDEEKNPKIPLVERSVVKVLVNLMKKLNLFEELEQQVYLQGDGDAIKLNLRTNQKSSGTDSHSSGGVHSKFDDKDDSSRKFNSGGLFNSQSSLNSNLQSDSESSVKLGVKTNPNNQQDRRFKKRPAIGSNSNEMIDSNLNIKQKDGSSFFKSSPSSNSNSVEKDGSLQTLDTNDGSLNSDSLNNSNSKTSDSSNSQSSDSSNSKFSASGSVTMNFNEREELSKKFTAKAVLQNGSVLTKTVNYKNPNSGSRFNNDGFNNIDEQAKSSINDLNGLKNGLSQKNKGFNSGATTNRPVSRPLPSRLPYQPKPIEKEEEDELDLWNRPLYSRPPNEFVTELPTARPFYNYTNIPGYRGTARFQSTTVRTGRYQADEDKLFLATYKPLIDDNGLRQLMREKLRASKTTTEKASIASTETPLRTTTEKALRTTTEKAFSTVSTTSADSIEEIATVPAESEENAAEEESS